MTDLPTIRVPHPRRAVVFAPRVGEHESTAGLLAPCLAFETWESDDPALESAQDLRAPSLRFISVARACPELAEGVGNHDPKPTLFPWCNE
jgi:hypothetical protein